MNATRDVPGRQECQFCRGCGVAIAYDDGRIALAGEVIVNRTARYTDCPLCRGIVAGKPLVVFVGVNAKCQGD